MEDKFVRRGDGMTARKIPQFESVAAEPLAVEEFGNTFLQETVSTISQIDTADVEAVVSGLRRTRDRGGRLFILGVGGSAGHASHAVNDFRKICGFEA
jgi:D-sedoheptulose 7-phosphate isomerase